MERQRLGILTRTVVQSPTVKRLLQARIRSQAYNDLIFVGDDFIHVKQVGNDGHLQHIATKSDFDARILAAAVFTTHMNHISDILPVKSESMNGHAEHQGYPPQLLVLTLDSQEMVFIYLMAAQDGIHRFVQQICPLPVFDRTLFQPGDFLAVDHQSRALAVAADEKEVIIFSAKAREHFQHEIKTGDQDWCPVNAQRPFQVDGHIQNVEFLFPPSDDPDLVILLIIVIDEGLSKVIWVDWHSSSGLQHARIHPAQPLEQAQTVPNLLIPLLNGAFLTINGKVFMRWDNILSGSATATLIDPIDSRDPNSMYPGNSPRDPVWVSWCRPARVTKSTRDNDHLYLIREDGLVYLMQIGHNHSIGMSSLAGDFKCHAGAAFTSLGDESSPDILAVAGEMSSGRINSIGQWPRSRVDDLSWSDTMEMELIEPLPNWASVTDMVISALPQSHSRPIRSRDGLFLTSGRQQFGAVTELRKGFEARLALYFDLDGLRSTTDAWALPLISSCSVLLLLTNPTSTRIINFPVDVDEISEIDATEASSLDTAHRTVAAGSMPDGCVVQVTEKSICISTSLIGNFEDSVKMTFEEDCTIIAAAICSRNSAIITVQRTSNDFRLRIFRLATGTEAANTEPTEWANLVLDFEPSAITFVPKTSDTLLIAVSSTNSKVKLFTITSNSTLCEVGSIDIPALEGESSACDHIVALGNSSTSDRSLLVCGLRDGSICSIAVEFDEARNLAIHSQHCVSFGSTTVKLTSLSDRSGVACAMCGPDLCALSWDGTSAQSLSIENIWVSDNLRPELTQGPVITCTLMPPANQSTSIEIADCLVMVSTEELLIASLSPTPTPVPRQIRVSGTPNRLLYAEQQRCLVCSSLRVEAHQTSLTAARSDNKRQIFPVIDFIPSRNTSPSSTYEMQPGERVYALLEWSFKSNDEKTYSFIMIGGSYVKSSGSVRGRVTFLQPTIRSWDIVDVKEGKSTNFPAPVYALALYDELTYVACSGHLVYVYRFGEERRWEQACEPHKLASPGTFISISRPFVYITTAVDSLVVLRFEKVDGEQKLVLEKSAPQAAASLSHAIIQSDQTKHDVALVSTKYGQIIGLSLPKPEESVRTHSTAAELLFEAQLTRSLTRMRQGNVRPRWRATRPSGVLIDNIIGCAPDGALVGIAIIDEHLWRRLSWLQRLCEWNETLSSRSWQYPAYVMDQEARHSMNERGMPIGAAGSGSEVVLSTSISRAGDMHVDGDVLARVLQHGGLEALKAQIWKLAESTEAVGIWIANHLDEELKQIDELVAILPSLLDGWL
ncbi:Hypothetical protein R9X50_00015400 [Acrodontium crateriforme]|uniref:Cleavage/polyadenylation specificity factor A subunit N-terminal domain-containing protein n=1 Tax=Acrodontium crateriforme TaxID=150365 RepID=A0AAQ3LYA7_9PEZI|nr:Hypothetical protein R9X50_00015400 [Acrodontium crateriforme]